MAIGSDGVCYEILLSKIIWKILNINLWLDKILKCKQDKWITSETMGYSMKAMQKACNYSRV